MNASHESKNSLLMSQFMHKGAKNKNKPLYRGLRIRGFENFLKLIRS